MNDKKYFVGRLMGGHVGRNYYTPIIAVTIAETRKQAAVNFRNMPRVKHHQKYAVLDIRKVNREEYYRTLESLKNHPDYTSKNIQEFKAKMNGEEVERICLCDVDKKRREGRPSQVNKKKYLKYLDLYDVDYRYYTA